MDLTNGMVSKLLLKKCGSDLQKECSSLAPLSEGDVAITSAKNLSCKNIYHINLRGAKDNNAMQVRK